MKLFKKIILSIIFGCLFANQTQAMNPKIIEAWGEESLTDLHEEECILHVQNAMTDYVKHDPSLNKLINVLDFYKNTNQDFKQILSHNKKLEAQILIKALRDSDINPQILLWRLIKTGKNAQLIPLLLEIGADVNLISFGSTPLHRAVALGHINIVIALLKTGANPFQRDSFGRTPKEIVDVNKHPKIFKILNEAEKDCCTGCAIQ